MRAARLRDPGTVTVCLAVVFLATALSLGCTRDTNGNVVKGPVAAAALRAHRLDLAAADGAGEQIAASVTGIDGSMRRLEIPVLESGPIVIVAEGGVDVATFRRPIVPTLRTLLAYEEPALLGPVHATPLTTLTLELAGRIADLDVGFYAGDGDGERTTAEFVEAVRIAEAIVRATFGLGLLDDAHLFASPPVLLEDASTLEAQNAALAHRIAVEAFSAFLVALRDAGAGGQSAGEWTAQSVLVALARDLVDGELDAADFGEAIPGLPDAATLARVLSQDPLRLRIPNSLLRIAQLNVQLALESVVTAPGLSVAWRSLSHPPLEPVRLRVDADGDGVADPQDAYPDDPTESADSDGDGVGDHADAYPRDAACWAAIDGDGSDCLLTTLVGATVRQLVADDDGVVYVLVDGAQEILRFDSASGHFLPAIELTSPELPRLLAWSSRHGRLYIAFEGTAIRHVEPKRSLEVMDFVSTPSTIGGLASAGDFVFVQDDSSDWDTHYTFDRSGRRTAWKAYSRRSSVYAWSELDERLYFLDEHTWPHVLTWEKIDQTTGAITDQGKASFYEIPGSTAPIAVSGDGGSVIDGSGDIYDTKSMRYSRSIRSWPDHMIWPLDSGPITLGSPEAGQTMLERRDPALKVVEYRVYEGRALGFFAVADRFLIVLATSGAWRFVEYVPSDDADGDGVANALDAFPLDPAASRDGDRDGHPDAWNPGHGPDDSIGGLVLDAYPQDSACFRLDQGDGTRCDIAAQLPAYRPVEVVSDDEGIVYLLSDVDRRIFRWSAVTGAHLDPLVVGEGEFASWSGPTKMAWSPAHGRIYLGYPDSRLSFIEPAVGPEERAFAAITRQVGGLVAAGQYVLAQDRSSVGPSHHVFDREGNRRVWKTGWYDSRVYAWSEPNARVYLLDDDSRGDAYPSTLMSQKVDQATGLITIDPRAPDDGEYAMIPPIRVSPDGSRVLLGSGGVYDGLNHYRVDALPVRPVDGVWLADGALLTIRADENGATLLEQWSAGFVRHAVRRYDGEPLRLVATADRIVVVTHDGQAPRFDAYEPTDDGDGDGVTNENDAFPLDPAASLDTDGDGAPDAWNPGRGPADSLEGLVLDAFPLDAACQLPEHALPGRVDVCDYARGIPTYDPNDVDIDDDGVIYLLSTEHARLFRWSIDAGYHLDPLSIGRDADQLAYVPAHRKLYLGYGSGAITQLDPNEASPVERPFAAITAPLRGLAAVGRYLMAQNQVETADRHHVFDRDGGPTDSASFSYYSRAYAWSETDERVFFFRDGWSPNDLHWEGIDQTTGRFIGSGETPYHGGFEIRPPIAVSPDGSRVLIGSGDLYDGRSLRRVHSLPIQPEDAVWLTDGSLLTIGEHGEGRTLLQRRSPDLVPVDEALIEGTPIRVVVRGEDVVVVTARDGRPAFTRYVPGDDGDGDGVAFAQDAFPRDPAASTDSDGDGDPDAWNPGSGSEDSVQGLTLDAFPFDSACQRPEQALPGQPAVCDVAGQVPRYTPSEVVLDEQGVLYLLSPENDRIFRWSIEAGRDLDPLFVGDAPGQLVYSPAHGKLYVGYASGAITQLDPIRGARERAFAATAEPLQGLASVGQYLLAQDASGFWDSHYVFDREGRETEWKDRNYSSRTFAWSDAVRRVYFLRDGTLPSDLMWEAIDQTTGKITEQRDSPYHGAFEIAPPIRVSPEGARVLLGSGDVYDGFSLELLQSLPTSIVDAVWLSDGRLVTIRETDDGRTRIDVWSPDLVAYGSDFADGRPLRIVSHGDELVVISERDGQPAFSAYRPPTDADGDGVVNDEDAFPTDPAASLDGDHDGSPDAWNPGWGEGDSPTGLVLDAFPDDFACQLPEHGVEGVCDLHFVLPDRPDAPLCPTDAWRMEGRFGGVTFPATSDFVPLCDGWLLVGDTRHDRIVVHNVIEDRRGATYPLGSAPGDLELDADAKRLYVSLPEQRALGVLDLTNGALTILPIGIDVRSLALGAEGELFLVAETGSSRPPLYWLPSDLSSLQGPWSISSVYLRFNRVANELVTLDYAQIGRYAFDAATGPLQRQFVWAGGGNDLAVSSDGLRVVTATSSTNGGVTAMREYDGTDFTRVRGAYPVGRYPRALDFDSASERLLVADGDALRVFDVETYLELDDHLPAGCADGGILARVAFSRGDRIAFGASVCWSQPASTRIDWFVPAP